MSEIRNKSKIKDSSEAGATTGNSRQKKRGESEGQSEEQEVLIAENGQLQVVRLPKKIAQQLIGEGLSTDSEEENGDEDDEDNTDDFDGNEIKNKLKFKKANCV